MLTNLDPWKHTMHAYKNQMQEKYLYAQLFVMGVCGQAKMRLNHDQRVTCGVQILY